MVAAIGAWVRRLRTRKGNLFSVRYRSVWHNAMLRDGPGADAVVEQAIKTVLTREDVEWYVHYQTYLSRLGYLATKPGYSKDLDESFVAKNLINVLSALGAELPHLRCAYLRDKTDHPNGPGAIQFYALTGITRSELLAATKASLPTGIRLNGRMLPTVLTKLDEEMVQYNACAAWRLVEYILTGRRHHHLQRNADLA